MYVVSFQRSVSGLGDGIKGGLGEVAKVAVQAWLKSSNCQYWLSAVASWALELRPCQYFWVQSDAHQPRIAVACHLTRDGVACQSCSPVASPSRDDEELWLR